MKLSTFKRINEVQYENLHSSEPTARILRERENYGASHFHESNEREKQERFLERIDSAITGHRNSGAETIRDAVKVKFFKSALDF